MERSLRLLAPLAAIVTLGACSLLNAPGQEVPGGGTGGNSCDCSSLDDDCNSGVCKAGKCEKEPKGDGMKCDDGDFCTDDDTCHNGQCIGGNPHACPDKDACHPGSCDKQTQKCTTDVAPDNSPCDDGDPCDNMGSCMSGTCQTGSSKCNDPPFTTTCGTGICVKDVGCQIMPKNQGMMCTEGIAPECATGACNNKGKCEPTPIDGSDGMQCDGGKFCVVGTACMGGECTGGVKRTCPSSDPCSPAACDEQHDVCNVDRKPDGTACNDGNFCHEGMTCKTGKCQHPTHTISTCNGGDKCCPGGCTAEADNDCFYWKSGVQQDVPTSALLGWTRCFLDTYDDSAYAITQMQADCNGSEILMGCGQYDPMSGDVATLQLAAMARTSDVLTSCSDTSVCGCFYDPSQPPCVPPQKNGVGFYFLPGAAWGFARGGDQIWLNICDFVDYQAFDATSPFRMCVHADSIAADMVTKTFDAGFRCGQAEPFDNTYARVAYKSSLTPPN
jgi:hypothetical protein